MNNKKRLSPKKMKIIESSFSPSKKMKRIYNISVKKNNQNISIGNQPKIITSSNNLVQYRNTHGLYRQFSIKDKSTSKEKKKCPPSASLKKEINKHAFKFPSKYTATSNNTIERTDRLEENEKNSNNAIVRCYVNIVCSLRMSEAGRK